MKILFAVFGVTGMFSTIASATFMPVVRKEVNPIYTDPSISHTTDPHIVFSTGTDVDSPLLVFLAGTGGKSKQTAKNEQPFIDLALAEGYRFIVLSYKDTPAISQICNRLVLITNPNCAAQVRQQRTFGDDSTALIDDQPQDAIVHRLVTLLRYLATTDRRGYWDNYIDGNTVHWEKVVLSGQSQGGGMSAYIAKKVAVRGVIDFSGGWDMNPDNRIASWYFSPSATPPERLYGTYYVKEKFANLIASSYAAMHIPIDHQFALDAPLRNPNAKNPGHGEGATNPVYSAIWKEMLDQLKRCDPDPKSCAIQKQNAGMIYTP